MVPSRAGGSTRRSAAEPGEWLAAVVGGRGSGGRGGGGGRGWGERGGGRGCGGGAPGEVVFAEFVVGFAGGQDVPDDHQDRVGDHDDGFLPGEGAAVAAPFHDVPVVEGFEVTRVADRRPGALHQDRLEVLVAFPS